MTGPDDAHPARVAAAVATHLKATGRTLVTAESCSGGWIAKQCTDLPGSSRWFAGGVVVYADALKTRLLGVSPALLARHGAVSEPVARAMALGVLESLGGDIAVAVTGIAGPAGGTAAKPVGTVCFAWAARGASGEVDVQVATEVLAGDREAIRRGTVRRALEGLLGR